MMQVDNVPMRKIILASSSPRRREILERVGLVFTVDPAHIEEDMSRLGVGGAARAVKKLALRKAITVALRHTNAIVIGADTAISIGNKVWSKPVNKREASMMLRTLSGKAHDVWTGFCIIDTKKGKKVVRAVRARVTFRSLTPKEISRYIATGEPMDGAGGYKIQESGGFLISEIRGDYNNIIGLPLEAVLEELKKLGIKQ